MSQVNATTLSTYAALVFKLDHISFAGPAVRAVRASLMVVSGIEIRLGGVIALVALFSGNGSLLNFE
jgi:hypothetical protein